VKQYVNKVSRNDDKTFHFETLIGAFGAIATGIESCKYYRNFELF